MTTADAKLVTRLTGKVLDKEAIVLAFGTAGGDSYFLLHPNQLNDLIERLLILSFDEQLIEARPVPPVAKQSHVEKLLTLPVEKSQRLTRLPKAPSR